jgi:undecaprenyl-diphosphatase
VQALDYGIFRTINGLAGHNALLDAVMMFIASQGPLILLGLLTLIWFVPGPAVPRGLERRAVLFALLVASIGLGLNQLIGLLWARPRPGATHVVTQLLGASTDPSFPSDHATLAFGLAIPLLLILRWQGLVFFAGALLLGFARVYIGRHYPGDVLGSAVIEAVIAVTIWRLRARLEWLLVPAFRVLAGLRLAHPDDAQASPGYSRRAA